MTGVIVVTAATAATVPIVRPAAMRPSVVTAVEVVGPDVEVIIETEDA